MYCSYCGKRNISDSSYCSFCGNKLTPPTNALSNVENRKSEIFNSNFNVGSSNYSYDPNVNKKKNYAFIPFLILGFFILLILVLVVNADKIFNTHNGKRTIMIYMVGSNLESEYGAATSDLNEMIKSGVDYENINIVVYTGGSEYWRTSSISNEENAIYELSSEGITKVSTYAREKMGSTSTLLTFLNYSYDNYKADSYSLIFWDHGGGPIYGFGYDEFNTSDTLSLNEIRTALTSSPFKNKKLEFVGFDACLMSSIETAYTLKDFTDYMIASEENEPGSGWDYSFLGDIKKSSTPKQIGESIINHFYNYYSYYGTSGITIALLDLTKVKAVESDLNSLFSAIEGNLVLDFSNISRTRNNSKSFGKSTSSSYDLVDI